MLLHSLEQKDSGRELGRIKVVATFVLACTLSLFLVSRYFSSAHPAFGFVAAFAEAATIGGLADWYAVVALFRKPLGLPIPHTAIVPNNRDRIADKLGEFIETHFLAADPVNEKLRQVDFAAFASDWLSDRSRSTDLAGFVLRLLPAAMEASEQAGLTAFVARRVMAELQAVDLAPLARTILKGVVNQGRHRPLLDGVLDAVHEFLGRPETIAALREKARQELPTLLRLYRTEGFLVKKAVAFAIAFLEEIRSDPDHPFRGEFDRMVLSFADRIETDTAFAERIAGLKRFLLSRLKLGRLADAFWADARSFISRSAEGGSTVLQNHLANVFVEVGRALATDPEIRSDINYGVATILSSFVKDQKAGVSSFIADQVKSWDVAHLVELIEANVGKDLQYIRFNGSVIGGLAGLVLYTAERLMHLS